MPGGFRPEPTRVGDRDHPAQAGGPPAAHVPNVISYVLAPRTRGSTSTPLRGSVCQLGHPASAGINPLRAGFGITKDWITPQARG